MAELVNAVRLKQNERLKLLLNEGVSPNIIDLNLTALGWAVEVNNLEGAKILIDAGANTSGEYSYLSPLFIAISYENIPMIDLLVENGADFLLHEGLITAIGKQNLTVIDHLLKLGADVNIPSSKSQLPITCAMRRKDWEIVKLLFENGVDVNMVDSNGETFLIKFARMKNVPMIEYLLQKKVDLNKKNNSNETALSVALANDGFHSFQLLYESGANSDITDSKGNTPLMKFTQIMNLPMIRYLLAKKVDLNRKNNKNETALSVSLANNDFRTFKLLTEYGADHELASQAIEDKAKTNSRFADYMSEVKKNVGKKPQPDEDRLRWLSAGLKNTNLSGQEAA